VSVYWILKRHQPPLSEDSIKEIVAEIDREIVRPLQAEIELMKAAPVTGTKKSGRKSR